MTLSRCHITAHAIERAMERIPGIDTIEQARAFLNTPAIRQAADFGAPYVRLGTGQRIVIHQHSVVTILPADTWACTLGRDRDVLHGRALERGNR
jgi:hypothetical protein